MYLCKETVFECFNMVPPFGCKMVEAWNEVSCKGMQIALAANTARKILWINADHNHKFHWNTNTNTNTSSHIQQINVTWHTTVLQRKECKLLWQQILHKRYCGSMLTTTTTLYIKNTNTNALMQIQILHQRYVISIPVCFLV